ncbi:Gfo/Idh/MocA family protein [Micromonospora arida]
MSGRGLRAGLVGLGHMGRHHARALRALDGVDLVAAVDPAGDPHRIADGIALFTDLDDMLRHGIDYAVLAAPTSRHTELGLRLAAAGVPTLIEKPLAPDPESARRLVDAYRTAGLPAAVGYTERFNPAITGLRARLQNGLLGDVFDISTRRTGIYPARIADVGVIHDLATHDIDLTADLTRQRYTSITARTAHRSGRPHEDLLAAIAQLADGTIAQHRVNWLTPAPERIIVVTGEHGSLIADTIAASLTWCSNGASAPAADHPAYRGVAPGDITRFALQPADPLLSEHRAFQAALLGQGTEGACLEAALHAVLVAHSAAASARTAHTMPVALA